MIIAVSSCMHACMHGAAGIRRRRHQSLSTKKNSQKLAVKYRKKFIYIIRYVKTCKKSLYTNNNHDHTWDIYSLNDRIKKWNFITTTKTLLIQLLCLPSQRRRRGKEISCWLAGWLAGCVREKNTNVRRRRTACLLLFCARSASAKNSWANNFLSSVSFKKIFQLQPPRLNSSLSHCFAN